MGSPRMLLLACLAICAPLCSQSTLSLKSRSQAREDRRGIDLSRLKSRHATRAHYVVELADRPTREMLDRIGSEQQRVVGYVPLNGFLLSALGEPRLQGLNVVSVRPLRPEEKFNGALLREASKGRLRSAWVVEFHSDIAWEERRALLAENGVELGDHPALTAQQALVRGSLQQIQNLTTWDEVAYVFPASAELEHGSPVIGCGGGTAPQGMIGALVQTVGDGWDGPGKGQATVGVVFQSMTARLTAQMQRTEIARALQQWSRVAAVDFLEGTDPNARKTIAIVWGAGSHGDAFPFDGPGKVLAHTFYPANPNPEPLAGDMHFDDAENWNVGVDTDVFSVALHELGHALGLAHSDVPGAVMYPYYRKVTALTKEDIGAIRELYETRETAAGGDGPGLPLHPGGPPTPSTPDAPSAPELQLEVVTPSGTAQTNSPALAMTGYVAGAASTPTVRWVSDRGLYGEAVVTPAYGGRYSWAIAGVRLLEGRNTVTVLATDSTRKTVGRSIEAVWAGAGSQVQPPQLTVTSMPGGTMLWTQEFLQLTGTASALAGVESVNWRGADGQTGTALGTTNWQISSLRLLRGLNLITLTVRDRAGQQTEVSLVVFRF